MGFRFRRRIKLLPGIRLNIRLEATQERSERPQRSSIYSR